MSLALHAPPQHGGLLVVPPREEIPHLLEHNHKHLDALSLDILGTRLTTLRQEARREAFALARAYHLDAGEPAPDAMQQQWIVAGHQPELFHPGVWVKNFALAHWSRRLQVTTLNLVIDNDLVKGTKLRVPGPQRLEAIPFDRMPAGVPYEEANVQDETLFDSVPTRLREYSSAWPFRPMLDAFWEELRRQRKRTANLGERFAAARRSFERAWGYTPFEVPLSRLCGTRSFARFAVYLLDNAETLLRAYNDAVHAYRLSHDLHSANHPVPDLARDGDWLEIPLWVWSAQQPRRRHLFVRPTTQAIELRAGTDIFARLTGPVESRIEQWRQLASTGIKLRTRALMTTLWSRLFLGDLFVHGIGGAKYDEVTDDLVRRLFHIEPPGIAAVSATMWLPLPRHPAAFAERQRLERLQRDLWFNPQRHLNGETSALAQEKRAWIEKQPATHVGRVERFHRLRELTEKMRPAIADQSHSLADRIAQSETAAQLHQMHSWREYAFCLYPEDMLRDFYAAQFPR